MVDKLVSVKVLEVHRIASLVESQVSEDGFVAPLSHRVLKVIIVSLVELSSALHIYDTACLRLPARTMNSLLFHLIHNILSHGSPHSLLFFPLCVSS